MNDHTKEWFPKTYARLGGALYLVNIIGGIFAIGYVASAMVVAGNAAGTVNNIVAHEQLYRAGIAVHILILLTNIPLAVIFYHLFKKVNLKATLLVVFFTLVGTTIEAANLFNQFAPLVLLHGSGNLSAEHMQALSYSFLRLQTIGFNLALVFFGCYGWSIGYLIYKSTFLPRTIGVFMAIGGSCYLVNSFADFMNPHFAAGLSPFIQIPSGLAELTFCLWLLIKGVNEAEWDEVGQAAIQ